jgi:hypothetical protein
MADMIDPWSVLGANVRYGSLPTISYGRIARANESKLRCEWINGSASDKFHTGDYGHEKRKKPTKTGPWPAFFLLRRFRSPNRHLPSLKTVSPSFSNSMSEPIIWSLSDP